MSQLAPCPTCHRHIRLAESACPFCGGAIAQPLTAVPGTTQRLKRAAAFAFTASLAITGCDMGNAQPVYGAPALDVPTDTQPDAPAVMDVPVDAAPDVARPDAAMDVPADDGALSAMYGVPPSPDAAVDSSADAASDGPRDNGGAIPLYGAVPPPDVAEGDTGGDTGGGGLRYGAPPPRDWNC